MPLFDPPRHDSAETIRRALNLGVNVKMITGALHLYLDLRWYRSGLQSVDIRCHNVRKDHELISDDAIFCRSSGDQLAIAKETGRRLGMGVNMYPSSSLLGHTKDETIAALPVDELIEKADGFAGVFPGAKCYELHYVLTIFKIAASSELNMSIMCFWLPEHKYEIVKRLQQAKHICGMTGDGVNDAPALKKADIGIAVADATDAARSASDIVLTEPGLSVIISAVLTSRAIFQRMKNYTVRSQRLGHLFSLRGMPFWSFC